MRRRSIALMIFALVLGLFAFLNSPLFFVDELEWTGLEFITESELLALSGFHPGNLFRQDTGSLVRQIKSHPWVADAALQWEWPNRLTIVVQERRPLAMIPVGESWFLLSEEGTLLPPPLGLAIYSLPLVTNIDPSSPEELLTTVRVLQNIPAELEKELSEYNGEMRALITRRGTKILVGDLSDLEWKFTVLAAIVQDTTEQGVVPERIDLRVPKNPVITLK